MVRDTVQKFGFYIFILASGFCWYKFKTGVRIRFEKVKLCLFAVRNGGDTLHLLKLCVISG